MKRLTAFGFLLFFISSLTAQTPGFNKRFEGPYPNSTIYKILIENDTIVALGDGYSDTSATERGIVLMKFDTLGNLIQAHFIYDSIFNIFPLPLRWGSLLSTNDGGYIMNITPDLYEFPTILKTDYEFNLEFIKNYQEAGDYGYQLCDILPIADGYLLFGGVSRANGRSDGYLRKINMSGDSIWLKIFGTYDTSESINDVKMINDSLYAVSMVKSIIPSMFNGSAVSLIKYVNANGEVLQEWESDTEPEIGYLREIIFASEDYSLLYGLYVDSVLFNGTYVFKSTISKLDSDFNVEWVKHYGKQVSLVSEIMFYNFENTIDGNYIAVGKTYLSSPNNGPSYGRGWLMKFSPEGDSIWSRQDTSDVLPVHFLNQHVLGGVGVLSSGSIVAGGYVTKTEGQSQSSYIWLIKITNDGCLDTLYCGLVNTGTEEFERTEAIKAFPNPAQDHVDIQYNLVHTSKGRLILSDLLGRVVGSFELDTVEQLHRIPLGNLPNGQYFYTILENGERVHAGKVIKLE